MPHLLALSLTRALRASFAFFLSLLFSLSTMRTHAFMARSEPWHRVPPVEATALRACVSRRCASSLAATANAPLLPPPRLSGLPPYAAAALAAINQQRLCSRSLRPPTRARASPLPPPSAQRASRAPPALAPATASSPSLVHDRCERLRSYGAEVDERVALLIELANDRNVIPSQHREPERFQLHAILHAKNALVRLVEDHVRRLIEALQQTLWCEQRRRRRIGKGIVAGRRTREGGMGAAAAAAARRMRKW